MKITECRVNHLENPLGYYMPKTTFSWKVTECKGKKQKEARICVAKDEAMETPVADTGWQAHLSSLASEIILAQEPYTRYYWTVSVRTDEGEEETSAVNWFETAKMEDPWQGKWITCDNTESRLPIFEKKLSLGQKQSME